QQIIATERAASTISQPAFFCSNYSANYFPELGMIRLLEILHTRGRFVLPLKPTLLLAFLLAPFSLFAQEKYDLLLKGGEVIDPKSGTHATMDVAIRDHKIRAVEKDIPRETAAKVIDASGLIVAPGLLDVHTHVYAGTGLRGAYDGDNSVYPDGFTF